VAASTSAATSTPSASAAGGGGIDGADAPSKVKGHSQQWLELHGT
jgi:hypothetical protein